jgi:hypothetical protein
VRKKEKRLKQYFDEENRTDGDVLAIILMENTQKKTQDVMISIRLEFKNITDGDVLAIHEQARFAALFIFDIFDSLPKKYPANSQF